jgi:cell division transport system permease protein
MMLAASARLARLDLPLEQSVAGRLLPWVLGALVYLSVVALGIAAVAGRAMEAYAARTKLVTVSLPSGEDARPGEAQVAAALELLNDTDGVTSARPVPAGELEELVEPWLGQAGTGLDLPLPRLIDVTLDPKVRIDLPALQEQLRDVVAGATIGVETIARDGGERMAGFVRAWGSIAGVAILLTALAAAALIIRVSLRAQVPNLELLRCMGASDGYLARQFERHALLSALRGGALGSVLAVATLIALLYGGSGAELPGTFRLGLEASDWALLACVPVISALLIMAVGRMSATRVLAKMP